jgi:hypothetical protein
MLRCRVLGHRWDFAADGATMRWECDRGCGASGAKRYADAAAAERYARALDRKGRPGTGGGTPLSVLPLRLAQSLRRKRP